MKLTVHRTSPQYGHETLTMTVDETRTLFGEFNIVAVASKIARTHEELTQHLTDLESQGVEEATIYTVPRIVGG